MIRKKIIGNQIFKNLPQKFPGFNEFLLCVFFISVMAFPSAVIRAESDSQEFITWEKNVDGTYTFTNHAGDGKNCIYAWYIQIGEDVVEKTKYTEDNTFTYDPAGSCELMIKGFVRIMRGQDYDQHSYKVFTSDILESCSTAVTVENNERIIEEDYKGDPISWKQNKDGSYTFINHIGVREESKYAWYVQIGEEVIEKTKYSTGNTFTYDLEGDCELLIKGFVRIGTEQKYEQSSYKVFAADILESCSSTIN